MVGVGKHPQPFHLLRHRPLNRAGGDALRKVLPRHPSGIAAVAGVQPVGMPFVRHVKVQADYHGRARFGLSRFHQQIDPGLGRKIILRRPQQGTKRVLRMEDAAGQNQK